jgi:hypothetical protein
MKAVTSKKLNVLTIESVKLQKAKTNTLRKLRYF